MNLLSIEKKMTELKTQSAEIKKEAEKQLEPINAELAVLKQKKDRYMVDPTQGELTVDALDILNVKVTYGYTSLLKEAKKDVVNDCSYMKKGYYGCKTYSGWVGQGVNCEYGYGPKHGMVTDSIGLKRPYRDGLTEEQQNTVLIFLEKMLADKDFRHGIYLHFNKNWKESMENRT